MAVALGDATWTEVGHRPTVLVPVGSIEQHGPHLPLDTDTAIAVAVSDAAADRATGDVVVAPPVSYGSSGEHQSFAGTCSIGTDALHLFVVELVRSLSTWAGRIVLVNAHGGNLAAVRAAVSRMVEEGHDVAWVPCATEEVDLHAGITETSLMLHVRPSSVRLDRAEAGETRPLSAILPLMMAGGVAAVSPNGVLGDPAGADAAHGQTLLETMAGDVAARVAAWDVSADGMLSALPVAAAPAPPA